MTEEAKDPGKAFVAVGLDEYPMTWTATPETFVTQSILDDATEPSHGAIEWVVKRVMAELAEKALEDLELRIDGDVDVETDPTGLKVALKTEVSLVNVQTNQVILQKAFPFEGRLSFPGVKVSLPLSASGRFQDS